MSGERPNIEVNKFYPETGMIIEYLNGAEFGSAKYQAFHDYRIGFELSIEESKAEEMLKDARNSEERNLAKYHVDISKQKIALLEHAESQKCITIPGYKQANYDLDITFDDLKSRILFDVAEKFPKANEQRLLIEYSFLMGNEIKKIKNTLP